MASKATPDFIFDQGVYYPPAANYYGYYSTGIESPGEWGDHNRFFVLDGQDHHYSGVQAESLPYVYFTPSYGYAQSDYNPYNPFIPGAVIGADSPFIGTQQYFTSPTYQQPVSSSPYVPIILQSSSDIVPKDTSEPLLVSPVATVASKCYIEGAKCALPQAPAGKAVTSQRVALGNSLSETSSQQFHAPGNLSEGQVDNMPPSKQSASHGSMLPSNLPHVTQSQGRNSSGSVQATDNFSCERVSPVQNSLIGDMSASNALNKFGSNVCKWATVDKFRPCFQSNGFLYNGRGSSSMLNEQDQGPRTDKGRGQWTSITVKSYTTKVAVSDSQGNIVINVDQYNRDDFPVEYPDAKFFVIKSYSEDDVHKSIKYNVWSSTPNGNRRLDSAYEDAQKLSVGKPKQCPVFLFFSVNASGQFCGVAEMTGPVDFHKDMDFWQQDKWTGSFPVRWHIIKDVPNSSFRHIILENNENKPVTHSRDTQEITYIPGMNMLKIFKSGPLKGSILDDFIHYEEREQVTREEKSRLLRRKYNSSLFVPAFVPKNIFNGSVNQPPAADDIQRDEIVTQFVKVDEKPVDNEIPKNDEIQMNRKVSQPLNVDSEQPVGTVKQHMTADGKEDKQPSSIVDQPRILEGKQQNVTANKLPKLNAKQLPDLAIQPFKAVDKQQSSTVDSPKTDARQVNCTVSQSLKADRKQPNVTNDQHSNWDRRQLSYSVHPPKADEKRLNGTHVKFPQADGKQSYSTVSQPLKAAGKRLNGIVHHSGTTVGSPSKPDDLKIAGNMALNNEQVFPKLGGSRQLDKKDAKPKPIVNPSGASPIMKTSSLSIISKTNEADCSNAVADVVTIGSVHIKVKDLGESSSGFLTFGTVPVDQQGPKLNKKA
ncbi:YTH domain-containing protein ECT4-like [Phoenix dactylifera]|uniref:YTH domain-containing protein ECT4-like n=1 Tax=Phoenix dactylifera TaxID=42345 RepID=A0A8B9A9V8_PHODC|nr:YTH domain-containing protein ECT4-like [Phoenix dactylifera]